MNAAGKCAFKFAAPAGSFTHGKLGLTKTDLIFIEVGFLSTYCTWKIFIAAIM